MYLITCTACDEQYVGETKRSLECRLVEHCADARHNRNTPVAIHFNLPNSNRAVTNNIRGKFPTLLRILPSLAHLQVIPTQSANISVAKLKMLCTLSPAQLVINSLCLLFVPEEEELYLLKTFVVLSVILCSFPVLWNDVAVFQFNVSLPHCNGKFV